MRLFTSSEHAAEVLKATPPATVVGMSLGGISLNQWVMVATLAYTVMQMVWFIYSKFIRKDK